MNIPTKVAGFALGLLAVFGAATGVGALVGPLQGADATDSGAAAGHQDDHGTAASAAPELPGGLMVSQDGYTLDLQQRQLPATASTTLEFRILGPDGRPVKAYTREHGKDLHLIVVRRDLTGFQHVHPRLAADGTWTVPVQLSRGGVYRVFADFTPAGRTDGLTLGADLSVAGRYDPQPVPAAATTAEVEDYRVALTGTLAAGQESKLTLTVSRNGRPVTDLQPYLEAYGHLVALRDRDLAYLHVHPAGSPGDGSTAAGPGITFYATAPSDGAYRLFLDFRHGDRVRTAEFTVRTGASAGDHRADQPTSAEPTVTRGDATPPKSSTRPTAAGDETGHAAGDETGHGHG